LTQSDASAQNGAKGLTNEDMKRIRSIRESTCIHACYYEDDPKECDPPQENGIPNCKREMELILNEFAASQEQGQDAVAKLRRGINELYDEIKMTMEANRKLGDPVNGIYPAGGNNDPYKVGYFDGSSKTVALYFSKVGNLKRLIDSAEERPEAETA